MPWKKLKLNSFSFDLFKTKKVSCRPCRTLAHLTVEAGSGERGAALKPSG